MSTFVQVGIFKSITERPLSSQHFAHVFKLSNFDWLAFAFFAAQRVT